MLAAFALILTIPAAILRGYVLLALYDWFVRDVFPAAPDVSLLNAIGISYLIGLLTMQQPADDDLDMGESLIRGVVFSALMSIVVFVFGFIVQALK